MTRTKAWRLSLAAILGFGWLFLTPAYSNDPLTIAAQQISDLNNNLEKLNDKAETKRLIDIAQAKYDYALSTKENLINAQSTYDSAILSESEALSNKNIAQNAVNVQEPIKNNAYLDLQNKQTNLDAANINLVTAQSQYPSSGQPGLNAYLYDCWTPWNSYNSSPQIGCGASPIVMGPWTSMYWNFGGGGPAGLYDDYQIHLTGYIKQTQHWTPQFRSCGDDGMIIIINGNTVVNNWWDRGGGCGASNGFYMPNNDWVPIEIWWYENGGGAWGEAQWDIGNGFITIPSSVLSTDIPIISPEVIAAQDLQLLAQSEYDSALLIYNNENDKLIQYNSNLINATSIYDDAVFTKNIALNNLNFAQIEYDNAILEMQNAISNAQNEYNKQWDFEEKQRVAAAIAQSLANQPQPTPEPSPEISLSPSPEPTPEQTLPVDPTPEPTPEITPEVTPTPIPSPEISPEPTQEPSPQPTDINPSPSVEPTQDPSVVPDKTNNPPVDEQTANLIADLTNSNTLTKLTPEQKNAVAAVLGIKSEEIIKIAELAKSNEIIADALQQFGERANDNLNAPMPYTLADATTEIQAEKLLSDPIGVLLDIDLTKILSPSEWGKDMTDDQRKKTQEVVIPVIIASNIVAAAMTRRI